MRISDWSSDVCSSDLRGVSPPLTRSAKRVVVTPGEHNRGMIDDRALKDLAAEQHALVTSAQAADLGFSGGQRMRPSDRSEERRVGEECVGTVQYRWWAYKLKKHTHTRQKHE